MKPESAMTLEAARAVYWLKNNHRPMGELYDERFLNESRLIWASNKAYDSRIQEAATVLLQHHRSTSPVPAEPPLAVAESNVVIRVPFSVAEARATPWPFRNYKGRPMGELSDTRVLSLKDLGYAAEQAYDQRVRQAAAILLAARLNQAIEEPEPPVGPLNIITVNESFSREKELAWNYINGVLSGVFIILWLQVVLWFGSYWIRNPLGWLSIFQSPLTFGIGVILLFFGYLLANYLAKQIEGLFDKPEKEAEAARRGWEGEERVVEVLRQNLDGEWTLFRNLTLPGRNPADIDAVLVGPSGVWVLEIKNYTGEYRNIGETWEYKAGNQWKLLKKSPSSQAARNAARLHDYLRADRIRQWVDKAVIWANPENPPDIRDQAVAVWVIDRLPDELGNLQQERRLDEAHRARIIARLTALGEDEKPDAREDHKTAG